jgi:biotin carboxyl carrier protein
MIIESMKMELEIPSPVQGKIASIEVTPGASVVKDDLLATIEG